MVPSKGNHVSQRRMVSAGLVMLSQESVPDEQGKSGSFTKIPTVFDETSQSHLLAVSIEARELEGEVREEKKEGGREGL